MSHDLRSMVAQLTEIRCEVSSVLSLHRVPVSTQSSVVMKSFRSRKEVSSTDDG
jgi:hypothetical protein